MLLYETGMTEQERLACLMEVSEHERYSLRILLNLHSSDQAAVLNYITRCQENLIQRKLGDFMATPPGELHLTVSQPFSGTMLHRSNMTHDFNARKYEVTLPYVDTNANDDFLWVELDNTPDLKSMREQINKIMTKYGIIVDQRYEANFNPHMTIGRGAADCPEESVTNNPGFTSLRFHRLSITVGRVV